MKRSLTTMTSLRVVPRCEEAGAVSSQLEGFYDTRFIWLTRFVRLVSRETWLCKEGGRFVLSSRLCR